MSAERCRRDGALAKAGAGRASRTSQPGVFGTHSKILNAEKVKWTLGLSKWLGFIAQLEVAGSF